MLYLVVISVVCAVFALSEGIETVREKNNKTPATYSHLNEKEGASFSPRWPSYHVDPQPGAENSDRKTIEASVLPADLSAFFENAKVNSYSVSEKSFPWVEKQKETKLKLENSNIRGKLLSILNEFVKSKNVEDFDNSKALIVDPFEKSMIKKRQSCENLPCCEKPFCPLPPYPRPCCQKPCCPKCCCPNSCCRRICYGRPCCRRPCCGRAYCRKFYCQKPCCMKPCCRKPCRKKPCSPKCCYPRPCCPRPWYPRPCCPKPCCPGFPKPCCPKPCCPRIWCPRPCCPKPCCPTPCPRPCCPVCCPRPCCKKQPQPKGCSCLTVKEKKKLMELINCRSPRSRKRRLDEIEIDEDIDIGKRIQRLTKRLALDRQTSSTLNGTTTTTTTTSVSQANDDGQNHGPNGPGRGRVRRQAQKFRFFKNCYKNPSDDQDPGFSQVPVNSPLTNIYLENDPYWRNYRNIVFRSTSLLSRLGPRYLGYRISPNGKYFRQFNNFAYFNRRPDSIPLIKKKRKKRLFRSKKSCSRIHKSKSNSEKDAANDKGGDIDGFSKDSSSKIEETLPKMNSEKREINNDDYFNDVDHATAIEKPFLSENRFDEDKSDESLFPQVCLPFRYPKYDPEYFGIDLLPFRYLNIRHALRTFVNNNGVFPVPNFAGRKKRCGGCCGSCSSCSMPRKCWRSAPLLCIPYIRRGQDELLKYLIKSMQKLLGKPCPQKVDIFEKTKFKPCCKPKPFECDCDDIIPSCDCSPPPPPCQVPCPTQPRPCPLPCPCPMGYFRSLPPQCLFNAENEFTGFFDQAPLVPPMNKLYVGFAADARSPSRISPPPPPPPPPPCPHCRRYSTSGYFQSTAYPPNAPMGSSTVGHPTPPTVHPTTMYPVVPSTMAAPVMPPAPPSNICSWYRSKHPVRRRFPSCELYTFDPTDIIHRDYTASQIFPRYHSNYEFRDTYQYPNDNMNFMQLPTAGEVPQRVSEAPFFPPTANLKYHYPRSHYSQRYNGRNIDKRPGRLDSNSYGKMSSAYQEHYRRVAPNIQNNFYKYPKEPFRYQEKNKYDLWNAMDYWHGYDYDIYDKYPFGRSRIRPNFPIPWAYSKKFRKSVPSESSERHKRSLDYSWPQLSDSNQYDYPEYPNYGDFYLKKPSLPDLIDLENDVWRFPRKTRGRIATPPTFELFSDLAIAMGNLTSSFTTPVTLTKNERTTGLDNVDTVSNNSSTAPERQKQFQSTESPENTTSRQSDHTQRPTTGHFTKLQNGNEAQTTAVTKQTELSTSSKPASTTTPSNVVNKDKKDESFMCSETESGSQIPTTLKAAVIAKGLKKQLTRPAPKIYAKVYPDIIWNDTGSNDCPGETWSTTTTTTATAKPCVEKTTLVAPTASPDIRLQLLAICEGYLEVLKLVKGQSREEIDPDLSRYCESIISQSFNLPELQSKPKVRITTTEKVQQESKSDFLEDGESLKGIVGKQNFYDSGDPFSTDRKPDSHILKHGKTTMISLKHFKKKKNKSTSSLTENSNKQMSNTSPKKEDLRLPRNQNSGWRSWLVDSDENEMKISNRRNDVKDAENASTPAITEASMFSKSDRTSKSTLPLLLTTFSGTIAPKINEKTREASYDVTLPESASPFPVYAKNYGYDSGGELREIEVLLKRINDSNPEKKIFKNVSVFALLLTSTRGPFSGKRKDVKSMTAAVKYFNEKPPDSQSKEDEEEDDDDDEDDREETTLTYPTTVTLAFPTVTALSMEPTKSTIVDSTTALPVADVGMNVSTTFVTMASVGPFTTNIVRYTGSECPRCANSTLKVTQKNNKINFAKDKLQEYSIEFLNYAVYILPIMFTVLFFFCCTCCFYVLCKSSGHHKRCKKKKKRTDCSSDVSSNPSNEISPKKRTKRNKRIWRSKSSEEAADKTRSFLKFLKSKKECDQTEESTLPYTEVQGTTEGDQKSDESDEGARDQKKFKKDDHSETNDRKEIIALLEDLKKIEIEHMEDRKNQKPVCVQQMSQLSGENVEAVCRTVEHSKPVEIRPKTYKMPIGFPYSLCQKHFSRSKPDAAVTAFRKREVRDDFELEELLPCNCSRFYDKQSFLKSPGKPNRLFKIFRDSSQNTAYLEKEMDWFKSGNENYIFSKYRNVSTDTSDELIGDGTRKKQQLDASNIVISPSYFSRCADGSSAIVSRQRPNLLRGDPESFQCQHISKRNVHLKDDGVLCKL